ncbi:MAG TPA: hypothetical protein GYA07_03285 [Verrucomicrobia bacterium]|nr:hypothetical protein [Verrucomicrobiota bacterium]HOB32295.1 hypothetical protein [Verrucomicrobiota bacterium]HOP96693.1 hypothetical protein [Verrucomicrobiota bacterium]HPU55151.1 hypothetical protein [Verrucomicrobiota bacterium]
MDSDTKRMHRMLLLWLDLARAMDRAHSTSNRRSRAERPWESEDESVRAIWRKITAPANELALEEWLCQCAEGRAAEWARQALKECRERANNRPRSG